MTSNPRLRSRGAPAAPRPAATPRPAAAPRPVVASRSLEGASPGRPATFRTPVRGHAFAARPGDAELRTGAPARLVREPANPRDPLAVAVWVEGAVPWRAGYLDRAVAARLAPRLDAGERWPAVIEGWVEAPGGWHRPLLAVGAPGPTRASAPLPAAAPTAAAAKRAAPPSGGLWGRPPGSQRRTLPG